MRYCAGAGLFLALALPSVAAGSDGGASAAFPRRVEITGGVVEGRADGDVLVFRGLPYAAPPTGDRRWRAPQPVPAWEGVRPAGDSGADCPQVDVQDAAAPLAGPMDEDCLHLDLWRPADTRPGERLPVLVWVHGGGFLHGTPVASIYDGAALARRGFVVVAFHYRLGRLGWFAHPALLAASSPPVVNFGTLDQIAALRWVRRHAAAFGGDPESVTAVGESAGAASILTLLTIPAGQGLFDRAVILSGSGRQGMAARPLQDGDPGRGPAAVDEDAAFARSLGIEGTGPEALAALRSLPAATVIGDVTFARAFGRLLRAGTPFSAGMPILDGSLIPEPPGAVLDRGGQPAIPLMIGTTERDMVWFLPPIPDPFALFGDAAAAAREVYAPYGLVESPAMSALPTPAAAEIAVDLSMHEPARHLARRMSERGAPVWLFRFGYVAEGQPDRAQGAGHAMELPYLFDTLEARYGDTVTERDRAMAAAFSGAVLRFVRSGDPNGSGLPRWPRFDAGRFELFLFGNDGLAFGPDPRAAGLALVERAADAAAAGPQPSPAVTSR